MSAEHLALKPYADWNSVRVAGPSGRHTETTYRRLRQDFNAIWAAVVAV
jgi:hypothetical protein